MDFYANGYPALLQYTGYKPEAGWVVQRAFDLGYDVVSATNPLFPATAVEQRLISQPANCLWKTLSSLQWDGVFDLCAGGQREGSGDGKHNGREGCRVVVHDRLRGGRDRGGEYWLYGDCAFAKPTGSAGRGRRRYAAPGSGPYG